LTEGVLTTNCDVTGFHLWTAQIAGGLITGYGLVGNVYMDYNATVNKTFVRAAFVPEFDLGDVNRDGDVNGLDVDPFVDLVLTGSYQDEADMNEDTVVNGLDVDPFVAAIVGGGATAAVPEPSAVVLFVIGLLAAGSRFRWGRGGRQCAHSAVPGGYNDTVRGRSSTQ
jgi:hypothetical protein